MSFQIQAINHVCLVTRDIQAAKGFYMGVLGLQRHHARESWLVLNASSTLHLVHIPEATDDSSLYHQVQHFALQVADLRQILSILLDAHLDPFQMDFQGAEHRIESAADPLTFGIGTLFVYDPDGNLVEFVQEGHGIFSVDMRPRVGPQVDPNVLTSG